MTDMLYHGVIDKIDTQHIGARQQTQHQEQQQERSAKPASCLYHHNCGKEQHRDYKKHILGKKE